MSKQVAWTAVYTDREGADVAASEAKDTGFSAKVFERQVCAAGCSIAVFVVIAYEKA